MDPGTGRLGRLARVMPKALPGVDLTAGSPCPKG
jgi:hypothetical protein